MLIRPKKGVSIRDRIAKWDTDPVFSVLLKLNPKFSDRVTAIAGDCALPDLGISVEDRKLLVNEVQIVLHCAATVRFDEPLHVALDINTRGTLLVVQLAKEMRRLETFVHVSTAFSNCVIHHINEAYYPDNLTCSSDKVLKLREILSNDLIDNMSPAFLKDFPNTYTFTKALAEQVVQKEASGLPACIFRPGLILATFKDPIPGWTDNLYGPISLLHGGVYGVLRVMLVDKKARAHIVPVDYCANMVLSTAWKTAVENVQKKENVSLKDPPIYNYADSDQNPVKWLNFSKAVEDRRFDYPLEKMIWYPFLHTTIKRIYVLIRPKNGVSISERIVAWDTDPVFSVLLKLNPKFSDRVTAIAGDCGLPDLGISVEDRKLLVTEVQIVLHCAATVRFDEPLHVALDINTRGTLLVVQLAKEMRRLETFVHVSTAFSNCVIHHINEAYYPEKLACTFDKILELREMLSNDLIDNIAPAFLKDFPNTYTFTKALAEQVVQKEASGLPACIFRPAMIFVTLKEPITGWTDNLYGPISILYGYVLGVLHVTLLDKNARAHIVPVDYCANMVLSTAWNTAVENVYRKKNSSTKFLLKDPTIYNYATSDKNPIKWLNFSNAVDAQRLVYPLEQMIWYPFLKIYNKLCDFELAILFYHILPGYVIDMVLRLKGQKPRMIRIYNKYHKNMKDLALFAITNWTFSMNNSDHLLECMTSEDRKLFECDMNSVNWDEYFGVALFGMREYLAKEKPTEESFISARKTLKRFHTYHRIVQAAACGTVVASICLSALAALLLLCCCWCCCFAPYAAGAELADKLRDDSELSQFYSLLEQNPVANATLALRSCTIFVPTNEAFQRHNGTTHVLYHITTAAFSQNQLKTSVSSDMEGNPPLYITNGRNGDIYVNNARIIPSLSVELTNREGKRQVMHIIDEVLEPLTAKSSTTDMNNMDAMKFMRHADQLNLGNNGLRTYRSQVTLMKKESLYESPGFHTFLVPVDEGFKLSTRSSLVDAKVIDGHVIPNTVIFTAASQHDEPKTSAAFEDQLKVTVSFFRQKDGKMYVKSNTISGDAKHPQGVVLAEIVKANIPIRNGVVHLIHRPLMIIDTTVTQFLQENTENGALRKFYEVIMDAGGAVLDGINSLSEVTILAPSNEAWNISSIDNIVRDRKRMTDILNMHIIKDRLNVEKIRQKNANMIAQVPTVNNRTFLYFNVKGEGSDAVVTVEGGGVNATVLQADVAQTNGYVHIIDRVLGVPHTTVLGKLSTDPMMSDTYKMGEFSHFNDQLNNTQRRYTFFVPRDKGWQKTELDYPSAHKKLFMRDFYYHSKNLLERHLVIADHVYTMKDLAQMSLTTDSVVLPTLRDSLKVKVEEEAGRYVILWNYKKINVYRPDVECTNGIIHVIDYPLMEEKDIVVSGG
ncbi:hypothetical protein ACLKA7_005417 [Drosophila subpalustris]